MVHVQGMSATLAIHPLSEVRFAAASGRFDMTRVGNNLGTIAAEYPHKP
jgi:hypothetical protein